jgi:L-2-hydroxyglutarate oxidase LhgO
LDKVDCIVIGAGVVGLAVARALAVKGREVMVLEAANAIGTGTSSRNSEVIHAGIYYPKGSLKAQLCVPGKQMLYDYCTQRGIDHSRCGKLIVAINQPQVAQLQSIIAKAASNGVGDLVMLTREQAQALEPQLECVAAIHSPSTGIVDSHALMLSLQGDIENAGGFIVLNTAVAHINKGQAAIEVIASDGTELAANMVINAAGLNAPQVARCIKGLDAKHVPPTYWAKGNYFTLSGKSPFKRLIYPVPEAAGLGVHLTIDLGGQAKFGPDVQWVDSPDDLAVDPNRGDAFYAEVRKYWPGLKDGALQPSYAGIRPKLQGPDGLGWAAGDFVIQGEAVHGVPSLVNLFGIESPGLTSCLAMGEYVSKMLLKE